MEAQVPAKQSATLRAITDYWTPLKHLMPSSPIIVKEWALGSGKVTYVNIQPILSRLPTDKILPALHKLLSVLGTNLSDSSPEDIEHIFNSHVATFRTMSAMGSITVNTSAVIFPISTQIDEMKMLEPNKREVALANVSNLQIDDYNYAILNTVHNSMSIANGTGLYSNLVFGNQNSIDKTLSLDFSSNSKRGATNITAVSNGRLFHFENISKIIIHNEEPIRIYARQPVLNINDGNTSFKELYFGHISGNDLTITGSISLSVYMSDLYTFLDHVSFPRDSYLQLPRSPYNEVTSLSMHPSLQKLYSLPEFIRFLLLIPILITFIFIVYVKPKRIRDVIQ